MLTILITGASSGLGRALAVEYAQQGTCRLLLTGRNKKALKHTQTLCESYAGVTVHPAIIDVTDKPHMERILTQWDEVWPIDIAIANAGVSLSTADNTAYAHSLYCVIETNLNGTLHTIAPLLPRMITRQSGHIALVSSLAGFLPLASAPAYSASKAGVRYLGEALSMAHASENITISTICPGYIRTPLTDKNTFPMPFLQSAEKAAHHIRTQLEKGRTRIIFPRRFYFLIRCLSYLPWPLQRFLLARLPRK